MSKAPKVRVGDVYTLHGFGQELDTVLVLQVDKDWFMKGDLGTTGTVVNVKVGKPSRYRLEFLTEARMGFKYRGNIGENEKMIGILYGNE